MRKNQNTEPNIPIEEKHKGFRTWKSGKRWVTIAGITLVTLGTVGAVLAQVGIQAKTSTTSAVKSTYPTPPSDTTVNWENNKPLYYEVDQTGKEHPKPELKLGNGDPAWCLGLGVALPNNSTAAQQSETNKIFQALTDEQKAIINNVEFLGRKAGDLEGYAEAQHATYLLLDEAKLSINQTKDVVVKDNTLLKDANKIKTGADNLIKEAKKMRELPSFNSQTIQLLQGTSKSLTDSKGVLDNFPYVKVNAKGVTEKVSGNNLTLTADKTASLGETKNAVQFANTDNGMDPSDLPWFVYSTDGDDSGASSQSVGATRDPSSSRASLNINVIGLGAIDFTKIDADTGTNETQGADTNALKGAVFGVFYKSNDKPVKWSDGTKDYPTTLVSGTKADDINVSVKIGDDLKGFVKNFDKSKGNVYLMETEAPEGYSLSTKKYDVDFDSGKFDDKTSNFVVDEKVTDKVNVFNFMFTKVQDVNGSYTGLNGAEFTLTPKDGTKGKPIVATSGTGTDSNGYTVNGLTKFDGEANSKAGNPSKDGIAIGNYTLSETKTPNGLQPINDVDVENTAIKDKDGKITAYQTKITDVETKQVIDDVTTPVEKMKDNNILLNVNLGQLTDKPVTPVVPTIKTKAHTKDGDQTIQKVEVSKTTPVYDKIMMTNAEKGDQMVASLHRIVTDKDGKVTESKVIRTLNFTVDDETVKAQEKQIESTVDTTKDADVPETSTVTYVWTEDLFDEGKNPKTDEPKAKHDDLKDQDQTLTVEKVKKPVTPPSSTTPSSSKPTTPSTTPTETPKVSLPTTGSETGDMIMYGGALAVLVALVTGVVYYMKKKKSTKEEG